MFRPVLVLTLGVGFPLAAQQTATVRPDVTWSAGTRLQAPWAGVTLTVPRDFQAAVSPEAQGIVMTDGRDRLIGVWAVSQGTTEALGGEVAELLAGLGVEVQLLAEPVTRDGLTVARFAASTPNGTGSLVATLRQGTDGNALVVVGLGTTEVAALEELAGSVAREATLAAPEDTGWRARAAGVRLTTTGTDHMSSRGGVGDGRYHSRTTASLALCRDGRYAYESETYSLMSVDGAGSMENTSRDGHEGTWGLVADILGRAFLVLTASDDREFLWLVEETADGAVVNGTGYRAEPGVC
jgi:hypothetical protein